MPKIQGGVSLIDWATRDVRYHCITATEKSKAVGYHTAGTPYQRDLKHQSRAQGISAAQSLQRTNMAAPSKSRWLSSTDTLACMHRDTMSTSNDQSESGALRSGTTSYENASSSGPMHAGHNYSDHRGPVVHNNIYLPGPGSLRTSALTPEALNDASARSSLPLSLAKQDLRRRLPGPPILELPNPGSRPGTSSRQPAPQRNHSYSNRLLFIFVSVIIFVVLIVCFGVAVMLIFNSKQHSS
jgi:hypothetical protein